MEAEFIQETLKPSFPRATFRVLSTERAFHTALDDIANEPPSVVILDLILRWTDPGREIPELPDDVRDQGFYRAGMRCLDLLRKDVRTRDVRAILYSHLSIADVSNELLQVPDVQYLEKGADLDPLIQLIGSIADGSEADDRYGSLYIIKVRELSSTIAIAIAQDPRFL